MSRPMKVLAVHPGASWSTHDVYDGLVYGLKANGVEVVEYRLDRRIGFVHNWANAVYRRAKTVHRTHRLESPFDLPKPTKADVFLKAAVETLERALRERVDAVVVVSAMFFHPDVLVMLRRANTKVGVLFTESPYDLKDELRITKLVSQPDSYGTVMVNPPSGVWTNERSVVSEFRAINPCAGYVAHAWHPERHVPWPMPDDDRAKAHDVVFVGTGFPERIEWFEAIDWTGIDLGLYGSWERLRKSSPLRACVQAEQVPNRLTSALYRRAKVNLNFYRQSMGWGAHAPRIAHAESLNPRAYELAACGAFHLSDPRQEVTEKFGDLVPTFRSPQDAETLIRRWLADEDGRRRVAAQLPACVAEESWVQRARQVIGDLERLLTTQRAA